MIYWNHRNILRFISNTFKRCSLKPEYIMVRKFLRIHANESSCSIFIGKIKSPTTFGTCRKICRGRWCILFLLYVHFLAGERGGKSELLTAANSRTNFRWKINRFSYSLEFPNVIFRTKFPARSANLIFISLFPAMKKSREKLAE